MQYFEPNFIDEALVLLDRFAPGARVLAGGTILGPVVRADPEPVTTIVNIKRIPELRQIEFEGNSLRIGALITARELAQDDLVRDYAPVLRLAAASMGARQLRNVATIGGNICSSHPTADLSTALLVYDATCLISEITEGPSRVPLDELLGLDRRARLGRALITAVEIPVSRSRAGYRKMQTRRAFQMALVSSTVAVDISDGEVARARIALGGAAAWPSRAPHAERALERKTPTLEAARNAADIAAERDVDTQTHGNLDKNYLRQLVRVLTRRALLDAFDLSEDRANVAGFGDQR